MGDNVTKRLVIKASNSYEENFRVVPVNTNYPLEIESDIGVFSLVVGIKNFDGSKPHLNNSLKNVGDKTYLNGDSYDPGNVYPEEEQPNLRLKVHFRPKYPIKGSELIFGNDFTVPIRDYVPTSLLATGLKFFNWFINNTVKGDVYNDKPYLYGLALNSFSYVSIDNVFLESDSDEPKTVEKRDKGAKITDTTNFAENLNRNIDNILKIPETSIARKRFFTSLSNCENFVFNENSNYVFQFDTNFLKLANSDYCVSIPTFGNRTFDINVLSYANEKLNNFNWIIKQGGYEGVGHGKLGLTVNFALLDEDYSNLD
ncbi:uncharacterized protein PRCAT00001660001 [Priceomyces carsonii]|uniref:uncharacterized protein n=1 Tax=Priceomyces carsonii TaxID=28549 RepID=UPI002EDA8B29|nr:unnamed protein product [Priceomyces carsonii]